MNKIDMVGQRFGIVTVIARDGVDANLGSRWRVRCDCGTEFSPSRSNLIRSDGRIRSCGCLRGLSRQQKQAALKRGAK